MGAGRVALGPVLRSEELEVRESGTGRGIDSILPAGGTDVAAAVRPELAVLEAAKLAAAATKSGRSGVISAKEQIVRLRHEDLRHARLACMKSGSGSGSKSKRVGGPCMKRVEAAAEATSSLTGSDSPDGSRSRCCVEGILQIQHAVGTAWETPPTAAHNRLLLYHG